MLLFNMKKFKTVLATGFHQTGSARLYLCSFESGNLRMQMVAMLFSV
jgi:hypothetical protein